MKNTTSGTQTPQAPAAATQDAHLPHDRDESARPAAENPQHDHNRKSIRQAHADVESGIEDTERIGTPNDVPGSKENG